MSESDGADPLTVYVVDDDRDVRTTVSHMLTAASMTPYPFAGGADFLDSLNDLKPGCILLDLRMPDVDGFEVMAELGARDLDWPIVAMTGHGEIAVAVQAMKLGAVEFLEKPFDPAALEQSLKAAFALLGERMESSARRRSARERIALLSARESDVLRGLLAGQSNKELARSLNIGLRTVEMHRGNMMERLGAGSLAEVVTLAIEAGFRPPEQRAA